MKKILQVSISSEIGGGPEHIFQLMNGLINQFEFHVSCPTNGIYYNKFKRITNDRLIDIPHRKFNVFRFVALLKYIKQQKIDLIHSHGKGAGVYCQLIRIFIKIPLVHTPHGINQKSKKILISKILTLFEWLLSSSISHIIFVSKTEASYSKTLKIWDKISFSIINNGTPSFSRNEIIDLKEKNSLLVNDKYKKIIITASRFDYQKNTIEFCKIAEQLPDFQFIILGDGEEKENCINYCVNKKVQNIFFIGNVSNPIDYFSISHIYLSVSRWEGLSMAMLEAMSLGLPIIASNVVGNKDIITEGKNGFLYNLGDIETVAACIQSLFNSSNYSYLSTVSKEIHDTSFSSSSMCFQTSRIYTKYLKI